MVSGARDPPDQLMLSARLHEMGQDIARAVAIHEAGDALPGEVVVMWELPTRAVDPCELMQEILVCEEEALARGQAPLAA